MKKHLYFLIAAILAMLFSFSACSSDDDVNVVSVRLSENEITLNAIGATRQLTPTIIPEDATNKSVSWESSDSGIVSVSENGLVRAEGKGTAGVTVTTNNNNVHATCFVTVDIFAEPTGVTVSPATLSLVGPLMSTATPPAIIAMGTEGRLTATVAPAAADQSITWSSSNPAVAQVAPDGNGTVIAVGVGTAQIRATASNGVSSSPCAVTVTANNSNSPANVSLVVYPPTANLLEVVSGLNSTYYEDIRVQLQAAIQPANAPAGTITWKSSDETRVTVTAAGQVNSVNGAAAGAVDVTATYTWGSDPTYVSDPTKVEVTKTGKCVVNYSPVIRVTGVAVEPASAEIDAGTTRQLIANVAPENATYRAVTWTSSNNAVATVNARGEVSALKVSVPTPVTITATTYDGTKTATAAITVKPVPVTGAAISPGFVEVLTGGREPKTLTVDFTPLVGIYDSISWASLNPTIASITGATNGTTVTVSGGSAEGMATIEVTAIPLGGLAAIKATCTVDVVTTYTNVYITGDYSDGIGGWWGKNGTTARRYRASYDYGPLVGIAVDSTGYVYLAAWDDNGYPTYEDAVRHRSNAANPAVTTTGFTATQLPIPYARNHTFATGMTFYNGDTYITGYGYTTGSDESAIRPLVWKNTDEGVLLPAATGQYALAWHIAYGSDGVQHVVGTNLGGPGGRAAYWKNGVLSSMHPAGMRDSYGIDVATSGTNAYLVGEVFDGTKVQAALWVNGGVTPLVLPIPDGCNGATAMAVAVNGTTVYIVGYSLFDNPGNGEPRSAATQWTVNVAGATPAVTATTLFVNDLSGRYDSEADAVYVYNGKVNVAGFVYDHNNPTANQQWKIVTWRNGLKVIEWGNPQASWSQSNIPTAIFAN